MIGTQVQHLILVKHYKYNFNNKLMYLHFVLMLIFYDVQALG